MKLKWPKRNPKKTGKNFKGGRGEIFFWLARIYTPETKSARKQIFRCKLRGQVFRISIIITKAWYCWTELSTNFLQGQVQVLKKYFSYFYLLGSDLAMSRMKDWLLSMHSLIKHIFFIPARINDVKYRL